MGEVSLASPAVVAWPSAPESVLVEDHQAHLWCVVLSDFYGQLPPLREMLSADEQSRAAGFRFPNGRAHYVIRRAMLRVILSRYLRQHPSRIAFRHGRFGKPELRADFSPAQVSFNCSHSGALFVCAVTRKYPVGVDVERLRAVSNLQEIASQYFSPREAESLKALPTDRRMEAFFACWTAKEAYLKATGEGIGEGLAKVAVAIGDGAEPKLLGIEGREESKERWQLLSFLPASGYRGAMVSLREIVDVSRWRIRAPLQHFAECGCEQL